MISSRIALAATVVLSAAVTPDSPDPVVVCNEA